MNGLVHEKWQTFARNLRNFALTSYPNGNFRYAPKIVCNYINTRTIPPFLIDRDRDREIERERATARSCLSIKMISMGTK